MFAARSARYVDRLRLYERGLGLLLWLGLGATLLWVSL